MRHSFKRYNEVNILVIQKAICISSDMSCFTVYTCVAILPLLYSTTCTIILRSKHQNSPRFDAEHFYLQFDKSVQQCRFSEQETKKLSLYQQFPSTIHNLELKTRIKKTLTLIFYAAHCFVLTRGKKTLFLVAVVSHHCPEP